MTCIRPFCPPLTPVEALAMLRKRDNQTIDGVHYYLDAPQGCDDIEGFFPCATAHGHAFVPSGETIDENSQWVEI